MKTTTKQLREFGLTVGGVLAVLLGGLLPWIFHKPLPRWPWIVGGALILFGLILPKALFPIHWVWMKFAEALGWVNSRILLTLVFYLIFTPIGWIMRLFKKDPMQNHLSREEGSFRIKAQNEINPEEMKNPF